MSTFLPAEKGITTRMPSTANFLLDSADRNEALNPLANKFQITRPQALLNGFFTRLATTEVVMEYNTPNVSSTLTNNTLTVDLSGTISGTLSSTFTANGFFTAAELIDWVAASLTDLSGSWSVAADYAPGGAAGVAIKPAADVYIKLSGPIADSLGIADTDFLEVGPTTALAGLGVFSLFVDLRPFRYLDFVSPELTYNQDLKDSTTGEIVRDVLCRWYMAWDEAPALDKYGFPVLMGYTPFQLRRIFNPPKQIRWDNIQPIGNVTFEVYDNLNRLAPFNFNTQWLMTIQVSEV
jgi:hypothetical protein